MASIIIRNLPSWVKDGLKRLSAEHGVSMEEEARRILQRATSTIVDSEKGFATRIRDLFVQDDTEHFDLPERELLERDEDIFS